MHFSPLFTRIKPSRNNGSQVIIKGSIISLIARLYIKAEWCLFDPDIDVLITRIGG
jgi:hypothetical protein